MFIQCLTSVRPSAKYFTCIILFNYQFFIILLVFFVQTWYIAQVRCRCDQYQISFLAFPAAILGFFLLLRAHIYHVPWAKPVPLHQPNMIGTIWFLWWRWWNHRAEKLSNFISILFVASTRAGISLRTLTQRLCTIQHPISAVRRHCTRICWPQETWVLIPACVYQAGEAALITEVSFSIYQRGSV